MEEEIGEEKERGCCCCGKSKEDGISAPQTEPVPLEQVQPSVPQSVHQLQPAQQPVQRSAQQPQPVQQAAQLPSHSPTPIQLGSQQPLSNQHPIVILPSTLQPVQSTSSIPQQSQPLHPTPTSPPITQIPGIQMLHNVHIVPYPMYNSINLSLLPTRKEEIRFLMNHQKTCVQAHLASFLAYQEFFVDFGVTKERKCQTTIISPSICCLSSFVLLFSIYHRIILYSISRRSTVDC